MSECSKARRKIQLDKTSTALAIKTTRMDNGKVLAEAEVADFRAVDKMGAEFFELP